MTFNVRLAEVSESKELVNFYNLYLDEYEQSNSKTTRMPFKQLLNDIRKTINEKRLYVVTYQNTICAFTDLMSMGTDKVSYNFIKNLYVKKEYRSQGVAKMLREVLIQRNRIIGTTVTYKRLREKTDYFAKTFDYMFHDIEHEQNASDNNLVYISTQDIWGTNFKINLFTINLVQHACQTILNRQTEKLRNAGYTVTIE